MLSRIRTKLPGLRAYLRDDSGIALATVVAVSAILFLLATMIIILANNLVSNTRSQEGRTKALHMADAGLNAYLYELRRDPSYFVNHPTLGPTSQEDGVWTVTAVAPAQNVPLQLTATGTIPSMSVTRIVVASVRFPTYAEYMFLSNADLNIGADAVIDGKVRSNGNVVNSGHVTGKVSASGNVSGGGTFDQGYEAHVPRIDFSQVTVDMANMRTVATASSAYFNNSGGYGFRVILNGSSARVEKVTGGTTTGNLVTTLIRTLTVPSQGVLFFDEDVWVQGNYSTMVTIGGARDIYVADDLAPSQPNRPFTCGLVSQRSIIVPSWYPGMPQVMELDAAMLAQTGTIYGDYRSGVTKSKITIRGSMAYNTYGYFALYSGNTVTAGFRQRSYIYDPRLELYPPPYYPMLRDGSLKVSTWVEQ
ncbi:MAG: polymer-forming cytoskeletal protein [Actinomycetia bacterium]|nr:polymer-forming cytoskeletal protein [Actinomycetes bacterium]